MAERTTAEAVRVSIHSRVRATAQQVQLVEALNDFVTLVGPYVRAGVSASAMAKAYDDGIRALAAVCEQATQ